MKEAQTPYLVWLFGTRLFGNSGAMTGGELPRKALHKPDNALYVYIYIGLDNPPTCIIYI